MKEEYDANVSQQSEEKLAYQALILDSIDEAVICANHDFTITYWNRSAEELYGWKTKDVLGKKVSEITKSAVCEGKRIKAYIQLRKKGSLKLELIHQKRNGEKIRLDATLVGMVDNRGSFAGYIGILRDVTEKKLFEENFHTLADNMSQLAWMADENGGRFWYNKRWYEYTGTTFAEVQGWGWQRFYHPDHAERVIKNLQHSWQTGEPWEDVFPLRNKDGNYRWFLSRALPVRDESGKVVRWFGTNTDITEQKLLQQTLEETLNNLARSNKELDQFAYVAAHDLKEPLRTISSFAKLLEKKYRGSFDAAGEEYINLITDGTKRMNELIQDLLSYARLNRGERSWKVFNCSDIVKEVVELLTAEIKEKNASIIIDPLLEVQGDPVQFKQLFQNLISNGLKFSNSHAPVIKVSCFRKDKEHVFSVKDNGIGIPQESWDKIFGLFQRLHTRDEYPGTGIGLSICKKIVENHKGKIWVESEPGKGSTFYFSLPIP